MGCVKILDDTTKSPIEMIGRMAGVCYNANIDDEDKNYKRGINCIQSGHNRTIEFPDVYMVIDDYSIRVIREFYTHIGGSPTRLQESTRYVNYEDGFNYYTPKSIENDMYYNQVYIHIMDYIMDAYKGMVEAGFPQEDVANILPLGASTKIMCKMNARTLMSMANQRLCTRTYAEYRQLMRDIIKALSDYSPEWKELCDMIMICKCDVSGYCCEEKSCGRYPKKDLTE